MEPPAGYQEIAGTRLGYLRVGGRQLFALAQVLSGPLRGVPRGRVCRRMERLQIQSRRCDLRELRALKALRSVPSRAVQCCLITLEDLHILCSSWGPQVLSSATSDLHDENSEEANDKDCVSPRMRATFPQGLSNLFAGAPHSPVTSVGYSSNSDSNLEQTCSSDAESDSSGASGEYRPRVRTESNRHIRTRSREAEFVPFTISEPEWPPRLQSPEPDPVEQNTKVEEKVETPKEPEVEEKPPEEEPPSEDVDRDVQTPVPETRTQQFDRLVRKSKLWCYARGFRTDIRDLLPLVASRPKGSTGRRKAGKAGSKVGQRSKKSQGGKESGAHPKRVNNTPQPSVRPPFSFLGNFPAPPSLMVGEDGDLCPAYSLKAKNPKMVPTAHPLWGWHPGGSAIPVPPSLKFRSYPLDIFE
ncbi:elongin BC and Polycomb repressive complex 2-associated protein [Pelobates fuscus]|uniref:elongin BC and Polycomb repressive complex 2-associated protein n=1 Tax=Pelobates fuscus TaxID=191477 RepID=UPI002FE4949B